MSTIQLRLPNEWDRPGNVEEDRYEGGATDERILQLLFLREERISDGHISLHSHRQRHQDRSNSAV